MEGYVYGLLSHHREVSIFRICDVHDCVWQMPLIWDEFCPSSMSTYLKETEKWDKNEQARLKKIAKGTLKAETSTPAPKPKPQMLEGDADNFLKLAAALKIITAQTIRDVDIPRAKSLLYGYLVGFQKCAHFHRNQMLI